MVFFVDEKSQIQALDRTQTPLPFDRGIATLTLKCIRRSTHRSTRQLEQAIRHYIKVNNDDPKPFVWPKTADDILASVERFCLRTSNSRH